MAIRIVGIFATISFLSAQASYALKVPGKLGGVFGSVKKHKEAVAAGTLFGLSMIPFTVGPAFGHHVNIDDIQTRIQGVAGLIQTLAASPPIDKVDSNVTSLIANVTGTSQEAVKNLSPHAFKEVATSTLKDALNFHGLLDFFRPDDLGGANSPFHQAMIIAAEGAKNMSQGGFDPSQLKQASSDLVQQAYQLNRDRSGPIGAIAVGAAVSVIVGSVYSYFKISDFFTKRKRLQRH